MNTTAERLHKFKSSTPSQWRQQAKTRLTNQNERRKARKIAMQMLDAMDAQGMTEPVLAERLGISATELSSLLKGHKLPTSVMMSSIASALGITLTSVL